MAPRASTSITVPVTTPPRGYSIRKLEKGSLSRRVETDALGSPRSGSVERRQTPPLHGVDMERSPCRSPSRYLTAPTKRRSPRVAWIWRGRRAPFSACRVASGGAGLVLSRARVSRGLSLLEPDGLGEFETVELQARLALAYCPPVWTQTLRGAVWSMLGARTPAHTTLHAWTEGLGAHALGLPAGEFPGPSGGWPFARVLGEAQARVPELAHVCSGAVAVNPRRYRSEGRHGLPR